MKKYKYYLIPPIIVMLLLTIIYLINGVYPFGKNTILNGDFPSAYIPIYYYMWDLFRGNANLFINFKVGMGTCMYDLTSIYGILSPFSWIIALCKRSDIPYFMSILFMIKVSLISVTTFMLFNKVLNGLKVFYKVLFSVFYALSTYVIVYYTNFVWLDNLILFPVLLLGIKRIIDKNDNKLYTIILFLSISYSFYISYMELLFILFLSFGYIVFLCDDKVQKRKFIFSLGIGTILAIGMSLVFLLPVISLVFDSVRSETFNPSGISMISANTLDKMMIILGYGFPILLFFNLFILKSIPKKIKHFFAFMIFITCIGVIFEPINLMWHTGSYIMIPYRYGFIPIMVIYLGALLCLSKEKRYSSNVGSIFLILIIILIAVLIELFIIFVPISSSLEPAFALSDIKQNLIISLILIVTLILGFILLILKNTTYRNIFMSIIFLVYCVGFAAGYIGIYSPKIVGQSTIKPVLKSNSMYDILKSDSNKFDRYKNLDNDLSDNYGFIIDKAVISNWHLTNKDSFLTAREMGYRTAMSINDKGGTIFSDNILGINKYISSKKLDNDLYSLEIKNNKYNLYKLNKYLGMEVLYNKNNNIDKYIGSNSFAYQNYVYRYLFNKDSAILKNVIARTDGIDASVSTFCINDKSKKIDFYVDVKEKSLLYFDYDNMTIGKDIMYVKVNDKFVYNNSVDGSKKSTYNAFDGIINLGIHSNEKVKVTIYLKKDTCISNYSFATINLEEFNKFIDENKSSVDIKQKGNKLLVNVDNKDNKESLFLPINYLNGYKCIVNGKVVKLNKVFDNFISIDVDKGKNKIELIYYPPFIKIGLIVSIVSLILFILVSKIKISNVPIIILNISSVVYYGIVAIMFFIVYIYAFIKLLL